MPENHGNSQSEDNLSIERPFASLEGADIYVKLQKYPSSIIPNPIHYLQGRIIAPLQSTTAEEDDRLELYVNRLYAAYDDAVEFVLFDGLRFCEKNQLDVNEIIPDLLFAVQTALLELAQQVGVRGNLHKYMTSHSSGQKVVELDLYHEEFTAASPHITQTMPAATINGPTTRRNPTLPHIYATSSESNQRVSETIKPPRKTHPTLVMGSIDDRVSAEPASARIGKSVEKKFPKTLPPPPMQKVEEVKQFSPEAAKAEFKKSFIQFFDTTAKSELEASNGNFTEALKNICAATHASLESNSEATNYAEFCRQQKQKWATVESVVEELGFQIVLEKGLAKLQNAKDQLLTMITKRVPNTPFNNNQEFLDAVNDETSYFMELFKSRVLEQRNGIKWLFVFFLEGRKDVNHLKKHLKLTIDGVWAVTTGAGMIGQGIERPDSSVPSALDPSQSENQDDDEIVGVPTMRPQALSSAVPPAQGNETPTPVPVMPKKSANLRNIFDISTASKETKDISTVDTPAESPESTQEGVVRVDMSSSTDGTPDVEVIPANIKNSKPVVLDETPPSEEEPVIEVATQKRKSVRQWKFLEALRKNRRTRKFVTAATTAASVATAAFSTLIAGATGGAYVSAQYATDTTQDTAPTQQKTSPVKPAPKVSAVASSSTPSIPSTAAPKVSDSGSQSMSSLAANPQSEIVVNWENVPEKDAILRTFLNSGSFEDDGVSAYSVQLMRILGNGLTDDQKQKVGELRSKINRGAYASAMKKYGDLSINDYTQMKRSSSHLRSFVAINGEKSTWTRMFTGEDENGNYVENIPYEQAFANSMAYYENQYEKPMLDLGMGADGNIHSREAGNQGKEIAAIKLPVVKEILAIRGLISMRLTSVSANPDQENEHGFNMHQGRKAPVNMYAGVGNNSLQRVDRPDSRPSPGLTIPASLTLNGIGFWDQMKANIENSATSGNAKTAALNVLNKWQQKGVSDVPFEVTSMSNTGAEVTINPEFIREIEDAGSDVDSHSETKEPKDRFAFIREGAARYTESLKNDPAALLKLPSTFKFGGKNGSFWEVMDRHIELSGQPENVKSAARIIVDKWKERGPSNRPYKVSKLDSSGIVGRLKPESLVEINQAAVDGSKQYDFMNTDGRQVASTAPDTSDVDDGWDLVATTSDKVDERVVDIAGHNHLSV